MSPKKKRGEGGPARRPTPPPTVDLGRDHHYSLTYAWGTDVVIGAMVDHRKPDGTPCRGHIYFDTPEARAARPDLTDAHVWQVQSWEPLSVTPSVHCLACGDHGYITDGRWVPV